MKRNAYRKRFVSCLRVSPKRNQTCTPIRLTVNTVLYDRCWTSYSIRRKDPSEDRKVCRVPIVAVPRVAIVPWPDARTATGGFYTGAGSEGITEEDNQWNAVNLFFLSVFAFLFLPLCVSSRESKPIREVINSASDFDRVCWQYQQSMPWKIPLHGIKRPTCYDPVAAEETRFESTREVATRLGENTKPYIHRRDQVLLHRAAPSRREHRSWLFARIDDQRISYESRLLECTVNITAAI